MDLSKIPNRLRGKQYFCLMKLEQKPGNTYEYRINIKMATYLVKKFLATPGASGEQLIKDMSRYLVQVKPDRANERNLRPTSFVPFNYRVA